jgi:RHS repeat-associated protein
VRMAFTTDGNYNFTQFYALQDANYNMTAVVGTTGSVLERYSYTPYGEVTFLNPSFVALSGNTSGLESRHLYTGRERDSETGLQLNRERFYDAPLGRWLTRDPIGYARRQLSLYEYVRGNPNIKVDPKGLQPPPLGWPPGPAEPVDCMPIQPLFPLPYVKCRMAKPPKHMHPCACAKEARDVAMEMAICGTDFLGGCGAAIGECFFSDEADCGNVGPECGNFAGAQGCSEAGDAIRDLKECLENTAE